MYTFDIKKLMDLVERGKYATTVAAFSAIDLIDQMEDSHKKSKSKKVGVQVMDLLADDHIQWSYISEEDRLKLETELGEREQEHTQAMARGARYGQLIDNTWEDDERHSYDNNRKPTAEELAEFKNADTDDDSELGEEIPGFDTDSHVLGKRKERLTEVEDDSDYRSNPVKRLIVEDSD